jgi:hypothetical protein
MVDALAHLDQVLGYVYDQSGGTSTESVQILEYAESIGLDMDGAYTTVWACRDSGLGRDISGMGKPCIQITPAGLAYVREMRDRRDDPALRAAACRTGLLRWFYLRVPLPDVVAMQTRQPSLEGTGEVRLRRLIKEALRMRPSRIMGYR